MPSFTKMRQSIIRMLMRLCLLIRQNFKARLRLQSHLIQEAPAAIDAAESEAENSASRVLLGVRQDQQKEMDSAVSKMIEQYKVQLTSVQGSLQSQDL